MMMEYVETLARNLQLWYILGITKTESFSLVWSRP